MDEVSNVDRGTLRYVCAQFHDSDRYKKLSSKTHDDYCYSRDVLLNISQNNSVDASEATLSRIVELHATKDHHSLALKPRADRLKSMSAQDLGGYMRRCLGFEQQWLARFFDAFPRYEQRLTNSNKPANNWG